MHFGAFVWRLLGVCVRTRVLHVCVTVSRRTMKSCARVSSSLMPTNRWPCPSRVGELYALACERSLGAKVWLRASQGATALAGSGAGARRAHKQISRHKGVKGNCVYESSNRDEHSSALAPKLLGAVAEGSSRGTRLNSMDELFETTSCHPH